MSPRIDATGSKFDNFVEERRSLRSGGSGASRGGTRADQSHTRACDRFVHASCSTTSLLRPICACILLSMSACLPACLPTYLPPYLPTTQMNPLPTSLPAYLPTFPCLPACLPTYLPTCLPYLPPYHTRACDQSRRVFVPIAPICAMIKES